MAKLLINDLFEDLRLENKRLTNDLKICYKLLETYRKCLLSFKTNCICDENNTNKSKLTKLETYFKQLINVEYIDGSSDSNVNLINGKQLTDFKSNKQSLSKTEQKVFDSNNRLNNKSNSNREKSIDLYEESNESIVDNSVDVSVEDNNALGEENNTRDGEVVVPTKPIVDDLEYELITDANGEKRYLCKWIECGHNTSKRIDLLAHYRHRHTNEKPYKCMDCDKRFAVEKYLKNHQKYHIIKDINVRSYRCDISGCNKCYYEKKHLDRHKESAHRDEAPFVCDSNGCSDRFDTNAELRYHKRSVHQNEDQQSVPIVRPSIQPIDRQTITITDRQLLSKSIVAKVSAQLDRIDANEDPLSEISGEAFDSIDDNVDDCDWLSTSSYGVQPAKKRRRGQKPTPVRLKTFLCDWDECEAAFRERGALLAHIRRYHTNEKPYKCPDCPKSFTVKEYLTRHSKEHTSEKFKCTYRDCPFETPFKKFLRTHYLKHKNIRNFQCNQSDCKKRFYTLGELNQHKRVVHQPGRPWVCDWPGCTANYKTKQPLAEHRRSHTTIPRPKPPKFGPKLSYTPRKNFPCNWSECDRKFTKQDDMLAHYRNCHTGEKPFTCSVCMKAFAIEKYLRIHEKNHSTNKLRCDYPGCNYETPFEKHLNTHKVVHSEHRPFKCSATDCDKRFKCKSGLRKHLLFVHSNEYKYRCDWPGCDSKFKTVPQLSDHKAFHMNERQFKCDFPNCNKSFNVKNHLLYHMRRHEMRYACSWPACDERFEANFQLVNHMNRHQNVRPHLCDQCDKRYFEVQNLRRHQRKTHKKDQELPVEEN